MARKAKLNPALSTLYNAPDVRESRRLRGGISEVDPDQVDVTGRLEDRLEIDVADLKASIERNGQRVPVLLRPTEGNRFALIYGRRRLEACRQLGRQIRAIITELEDDQALKDQLLENQARRDLSFIERALVATALLDGDHLADSERSNKGVAEVLNLTEAGVSQMLSVVRVVGDDLIRAIGAAPGIGRPRWEDLKRAMSNGADREALLEAAAEAKPVGGASTDRRSDKTFLTVLEAAQNAKPAARPTAPSCQEGAHKIEGIGLADVKTGGRGKRLKLDLQANDPTFISWLESNAPALITELHERWKRSEE